MQRNEALVSHTIGNLHIKVDEPYFAFNSYSNQSIIEISSFEPSEFRKSNRNLYFMEQSL